MSFLLRLCLGLIISWRPHWLTQRALDVPSNGDKLSGIGIIHGWKCEAEGDITVRFNGWRP